MINIPEIIDETTLALREAVDEKRKELAKGYYPTSMEIIGVTVPEMRKIINEVRQIVKNELVSDIILLAKAFVNTKIFECQMVGFEIIAKNKKALKALNLTDVEELAGVQDNWVSTDYFNAAIAGIAWREGQIPEQTVYDWAKSPDLWKRRSALVCTIALNQKSKGGKGDVKRTLNVCEILAHDKTDMVAKALSWALRELLEIDKEPVRDFLDKYQQVLSKRVIRETTTKLETGLKNIKK